MIRTPEGDAERALQEQFYIIDIDYEDNIEVRMFADRADLRRNVVDLRKFQAEQISEPFYFEIGGISKVEYFDVFEAEEHAGTIIIEPFESLEFDYWHTVNKITGHLKYSHIFPRWQAIDIAAWWNNDPEVTPELLEEIQDKIDDARQLKAIGGDDEVC